MIIEIEGKRRRFKGVQVYKNRGERSYFLVVPVENRPMYYYIVTPFWVGVETTDLVENWRARFFQQIISADRYDVGEIHMRHLRDPSHLETSWTRTPKPWQDLFMRAIEDWNLLGIHGEKDRQR